MVQSFQKDVGRDVDKDKIVPPRRKRWLIAPRVSSLVVARFPQLNPLLVQILVNRGITTPEQAEAFLVPDKLIHNPLELYQMSRVVDRLRRAIRAGEPVAVYGDFDVDGVTATVLLVQTLLSLGARVKPYIPHRIDEGYGLNHEALKQLQGTYGLVVMFRDWPEVLIGARFGRVMNRPRMKDPRAAVEYQN